MPILVISDIHANLTALEAVLEDAGDRDSVWCLGDLVGYGPDPNECVRRVAELENSICLLGNHDAAALDRLDLGAFNLEARLALQWTRDRLSAESAEYLAQRTERAEDGLVTLVHGSPREPVWEYLLDTQTATANFSYFETPYCFVGHSHLPIIYQLKDGRRRAELLIPAAQEMIALIPRAILNPGSVGQPRDQDPRAAYALFDPEKQSWELRRITYDVRSVQERMQKAGLPLRHIQRLAGGW